MPKQRGSQQVTCKPWGIRETDCKTRGISG
jgi:hypothetical protein